MNILGLIPARGGSKGIPRKNIKLLNGKPLIQYSIEVAQKVKCISKVVVSTDDLEIAEVSRFLGAEVPGLRPTRLANDQSPTIETIAYTLNLYEEEGVHFDAVCLLQPTSPFRSQNDIEQAISLFEEKGTDSLISVIEVPHQFNPHWVFVPNEKEHLQIATGEKNIISRRQELPKAFIRNGAIYLTKSSVILDEVSIYGNSVSYYTMPSFKHVNIDTLEDWRLAESFLERV